MSLTVRLPQVPELHEPPEEADTEGCIPVSYTHLTLPTILLV